MLREAKYRLKLYLTDHTLRSRQALVQLRRLCDEQFPDRYELEVVDVLANPGEAKAQRILATPTVVRELPHPIRRIIGDLADIDKVLAGLALHPSKHEKED
ncbi:MAG: circadian clock KaiB family protein [Rhodocyclaceae bacterium]|nr:circadian clock KaiB family protein [Rhodocyclaceae bacterium]